MILNIDNYIIENNLIKSEKKILINIKQNGFKYNKILKKYYIEICFNKNNYYNNIISIHTNRFNLAIKLNNCIIKLDKKEKTTIPLFYLQKEVSFILFFDCVHQYDLWPDVINIIFDCFIIKDTINNNILINNYNLLFLDNNFYGYTDKILINDRFIL